MNKFDWNRPSELRASAQGKPSSSVGSLPAPASDEFSSQVAFGEAGLARGLAGHWREAIFAERALGWVLWTALAAVLIFVSG